MRCARDRCQRVGWTLVAQAITPPSVLCCSPSRLSVCCNQLALRPLCIALNLPLAHFRIRRNDSFGAGKDVVMYVMSRQQNLFFQSRVMHLIISWKSVRSKQLGERKTKLRPSCGGLKARNQPSLRKREESTCPDLTRKTLPACRFCAWACHGTERQRRQRH